MILFLMVLLPIAAALIVYPLGRKNEKLGNALIIIVTAAEFVMALFLFFSPARGVSASELCGMGLSFASGSLRNIMALIAAFMWLMTALTSPEYFYGSRSVPRYYCFYLWTLGALMGVFLAGDLMTLFIFFEIMSFTSYVWVVQNETPEALRAGETYLFIAVIGGLTMLVGLFLIYHGCGTLDLNGIRENAYRMSSGTRLAAGLCLLAGFGAKAGMFPLHIWLPKAHPVAPAPASALLSGILTKSGIFGVIITSCWLFADVAQWGSILLIPAVITMVLGAALAVFSTDLKRTLACSSMSQIGFILTGISMCSLLGGHGSLAACGVTLHILNHSLIKLALFTAAGVIYLNLHSLDLNEIRGFGRGKPLLMLCFLSAACSIAGIPGFSGYISKTLLHESIVEYIALLGEQGVHSWPYSLVEWLFLISGGLTFAYMARLFYIIFLAPKAPGQHEKPGRCMGVPTAAVLTVAAVLMPLLGLTAHSTMDRIAALASSFFHQHIPEHAVHYFSVLNLKGALTSIGIGCVVFILADWGLLTKRSGGEERYINIWPEQLDLENRVYRPLLSGLSFIGAAAARFAESLAAMLIYGTVNLMLLGSKKTVEPHSDENFAAYVRPAKRSIVQRTFSSDLLAASFGIAIFLALVLVMV
ncbi:MAG: proton-conducting transporter membrane subunit [Candidatus Limivicinus sp.]|nr:proton-conducting transporter membrane subunit [Candidatus Limivicinus sp.]